jgi:hypothetical protein
MKRTSVWAILLVAGVLLAGCSKPVEERILPAPGSIPGLEGRGKAKVYGKEDLWEYMDGGAEHYLKKGFVRLFTRNYRLPGDVRLTVDIFELEKPEYASELFQEEGPADSLEVGIGEGSILLQGSLVFYRNRFLVRVTSVEESQKFERVLSDLGAIIDRNIRKIM